MSETPGDDKNLARLVPNQPPARQSSSELAKPDGSSLALPGRGDLRPLSKLRELEIKPPGGNFSIGEYPADTHLSVHISIVGKGNWADLRWWLSQEREQGDAVPFTLHVMCARPLKLKLSIKAVG